MKHYKSLLLSFFFIVILLQNSFAMIGIDARQPYVPSQLIIKTDSVIPTYSYTKTYQKLSAAPLFSDEIEDLFNEIEIMMDEVFRMLSMPIQIQLNVLAATQTGDIVLLELSDTVSDNHIDNENLERLSNYLGKKHVRVYYNYILTADSTFPNDPGFDDQWALHNEGYNLEGTNKKNEKVIYEGKEDADIDLPEAWETFYKNRDDGSEVIVAVIDTGVDYDHEDLKENMWLNQYEDINNNGKFDAYSYEKGGDLDDIDNDGNGYVDDVVGLDFTPRYYGDGYWDYSDSPDPMDDNMHGTHVSGIIAATSDNNIGISGIYWNAKIMAIKFLDENGSGTLFSAVKAIEYAAKNNAKIINASWGGTRLPDDNDDDDDEQSDLEKLEQAINNALSDNDLLFVAAAGNGGIDGKGDDNDKLAHYPSSFENDKIIAVAATDNKDSLTSFSNYGKISVDVAAPGFGIISTVPNNKYDYASGTSMASPVVSGIAALLLGYKPTLTSTELRTIILGSTDQIETNGREIATNGRVNANKALNLLIFVKNMGW